MIIEMIVYRQLTACVGLPQFVGGPLGSWGSRLQPAWSIGESGPA